MMRFGPRSHAGWLASGCVLAWLGCVSPTQTQPTEAESETLEAASIPVAGPSAEVAEQMQAWFQEVWMITRDAGIPAAQKRASVEALVSNRLDYATLSRAALGPLASRFTPEQYAEFAHEYSRYVTSLLVARFARYPERPVEVESADYDPERGSVRIRARGSAMVAGVPGVHRQVQRERMPLELRLRQRYGDWRVFAVVMNQVDVSRNFRDQFREVLGRSDPEALIRELHERNRKRAEENPFASSVGS